MSVELILPVANGEGALIRLRCLVFVEEETEEEAEEEKETLEALEAVDKVVPCNGEELMGNRERGLLLLLLLLKLLSSIGVSGADTERRVDNFFSCLVLDLDLDPILLLFLLRLDPRSVEVGGALWFFVVRVAWLGFRLSPVILLIVDLIFRHLVFGARRLGLDNASSISQASSSFIVRGGRLGRTEGRTCLKMTASILSKIS